MDLRRRIRSVFEAMFRSFGSTHAQRIAQADLEHYARLEGRHFSQGSRPVIRWIKGNGLDDDVTRAAIGQATRLFGTSVDYCLCTHDITPERARRVMSWAEQPVEWWPLDESDNPELAELLQAAGCPPEAFGYWWKWFPERVRPGAPEWILDGDMVVTARPEWFDAWLEGKDPVRVAQDDKGDPHIYGAYSSKVDPALALYSGLVSLPPGLRYMKQISEIIRDQPLNSPHDGRKDMCEQGVIAACFQAFDPKPIPLNEFPFGRGFEDEMDFGLSGDIGRIWGCHFGNAFHGRNRHFDRLTREGVIFSAPEPDTVQAADWLCGHGQWGVPGWSTSWINAKMILHHALAQPGREILELGTSRGHLTAILAANGFRIQTVDRIDRGARQNLAGLDVEVILSDAIGFLRQAQATHDVIVFDLHGNSPRDWAQYRDPLMARLRSGGTLLINNAALHQIDEWREESGVGWFLTRLPRGWTYTIDDSVVPGIAIVKKP